MAPIFMLHRGPLLVPRPSVNNTAVWITGCVLCRKRFLCFYASVGSVMNMRPLLAKENECIPLPWNLSLSQDLCLFFFSRIVPRLSSYSFQKPTLFLPPYDRLWNPLTMTTESLEFSLSRYSLFFHHSCLFHGNSPSDLLALDLAPVLNTPLTRVSF